MALGDAAVAIAERPGRDLEIALYPAALAEVLGPELRADLQAAADGRKSPSEIRKQLTDMLDGALGRVPGLGADDAAKLDDSLSSLDDTTPEEANQFVVLVDALLTLASDVPEIGVGINIESAGVVLASWAPCHQPHRARLCSCRVQPVGICRSCTPRRTGSA